MAVKGNVDASQTGFDQVDGNLRVYQFGVGVDVDGTAQPNGESNQTVIAPNSLTEQQRLTARQVDVGRGRVGNFLNDRFPISSSILLGNHAWLQ